LALTKRDVFFFIERLCEQVNCVLKHQYKGQFGFFRNFKIKGGNVRLTNYVLQSITSPSGASCAVEICNLVGQVLCNYSIGPTPFLSLAYNVNSLSSCNVDEESVIIQGLIYNVNQLNYLSQNQYNSISQYLTYNVNNLSLFNSNQYSIISQSLTYNVSNLKTQLNSCVEGLSCLVSYSITKQ
jgi:hypothetical protein